ncbi:30S ribosomal protein S9 [Planoprotostelium fungivorum]|uniref:30S ribosomal protein S9 n=1 Tax=Planoprotostelium fungivorum TaxID=1890364 RepID=A0A2P6N262_9EUKA|nr:30S ribosomal protein S9 [Planoprotostelium fungivorum]
MLRTINAVPHRGMVHHRPIVSTPRRSYATLNTQPLRTVDPMEGRDKTPTRVDREVYMSAKYFLENSKEMRITPKREVITTRTNISDETLVRGRKAQLYKSPMEPHIPVLQTNVAKSLSKTKLREIKTLELENGSIIYVCLHYCCTHVLIVEQYAQARGTRKTAAALASIKPGNGLFTVNGRPMNEYFRRYSSREMVLEPFLITRTLCEFDIAIKVMGGGLTGQAGAIQLAVARALQNWEPEHRGQLRIGQAGAIQLAVARALQNWEPEHRGQLRIDVNLEDMGIDDGTAGMLTRDPRQVERKKYGQKKARKKFQWVKR